MSEHAVHALPPRPLHLPATPQPVARSMDPSPPWRAAARWVWHGRFGTIVIEVRGDDVFVDGDRVEPHAP